MWRSGVCPAATTADQIPGQRCSPGACHRSYVAGAKFVARKQVRQSAASGASTAKYSGDGALSVVCVRPYTKSAFARVPSASATRPGLSPVSN